jgi:hypothetical protein
MPTMAKEEKITFSDGTESHPWASLVVVALIPKFGEFDVIPII